jgi:hypothetical protein
MRRKGQALVVVVLVFALIMSVFATSISTAMRSQAFEETEIYQREQALYIAQMGINQMIYNANNGTTYASGQTITGTSPSGIGSYKATYVTPDVSGYGGIAAIKGEGTVGQFTRVIYSSLRGSGSTDAFRYCLYTAQGGYTKTHTQHNQQDYPSISFANLIYGGYAYNTASGTPPTPEWTWYATNYTKLISTGYSTYDYNPFASDNGKVVYVKYTGSGTRATLNLILDGGSSISLSVMTDYPRIVVRDVNTSTSGGSFAWNPASYGGTTYPIIVHNPSSTSNSRLYFSLDNDSHYTNKQIRLNGFVYSNSATSVFYDSSHPAYVNFNGEIVAKSFSTDSDYDETTFTYTTDYFASPPPHFTYTPSGAGVTFLPGSYREEY